jgi:hypothetical protein
MRLNLNPNSIRYIFLYVFLGTLASPIILYTIDFSVGWVLDHANGTKNTEEKWLTLKRTLLFLTLDSPNFVALSPDNAKKIQKFGLPYDKKGGGGTWITQPSYDSHGRRVSLGGSPETAKHFSLFFGGSWIHGNGVTDPETLPSLAQKKWPGFQSYNYGISGGSPSHSLALIARRQLPSALKQKSGIAVFEISDASFFRVYGIPATKWLENLPMVELNDRDEIGFRGTLNRTKPLTWFFYRWLDLSIFDLMLKPNWSFSPQGPLLCRIVKESKKILSEQLQLNNFYVLNYARNPDRRNFIANCLKDAGIPVLILLVRINNLNCMSKLDITHPGAQTFSEISNYLHEKIFFKKPDYKNYDCIEILN